MFAILLEKISLHHSIIFFQYMIFFQYVEVNFSSINQLTDPLLFFFLQSNNMKQKQNLQYTMYNPQANIYPIQNHE